MEGNVTYKIKEIDTSTGEIDVNDLPKLLAKHDESGWELCSIMDGDPMRMLLVYRKTAM